MPINKIASGVGARAADYVRSKTGIKASGLASVQSAVGLTNSVDLAILQGKAPMMRMAKERCDLIEMGRKKYFNCVCQSTLNARGYI